MIQKKRICLIIPSLQAGGMERVMANLANYLVLNKNYEVHLVLYGLNREIFYSISDEVIVERPEFDFTKHSRLISTAKSLLFVRNQVQKIRPDSILSFGEYWNNFVLLALVGLKFPIYLSDRSQPDKPLKGGHELLRKILYRNAKGIVAQTNQAKSIFSKLIKHKNIEVIGNPILKVEPSNLDRENHILMVGRLIQSKNHDILIKIFSRLRNENWKLIIVGYDHLKQKNQERLIELAKSLSVIDQIVFAGKQKDVLSYYQTSKIFAFTSSSEGFPNVVGEAMAASLPVISFDCVAGPSDLITNGEDGFLIPLFDEDSFVEKLQFLMDNEEERVRMGQKACFNMARFDANIINAKFEQFILNSN